MQNWDLLVVADQKTPVRAYEKFGITVLTVEEQQRRWPKLSSELGWNTMLRRNFGFLHAWEAGYKLVVSVDDDNIPFDHWDEQPVFIRNKSSLKTYT